MNSLGFERVLLIFQQLSGCKADRINEVTPLVMSAMKSLEREIDHAKLTEAAVPACEYAAACSAVYDYICREASREQMAVTAGGAADNSGDFTHRERVAHHRWLEAIEQAMEALKDTSVSVDSDTVKLRKGVKKFRAENYVIYDVNYLLENLAREIFLLYQTVSDFNKPVFDLDKIRRMFVDYAPCEECTNPDTYGEICVKCGVCGRKFDDKGVMI